MRKSKALDEDNPVKNVPNLVGKSKKAAKRVKQKILNNEML